MNKGFFVVFLGVVLGAMVLIFINQTSGPAVVSVPAGQTGSAVPEPETGTAATAASTVATTVAAPQPAKPEIPAKPETPRPAEPAAPETPKLEIPKPETKPEAPKPEIPKPETSKPAEPAAPETPKPEVAKPETPRAETPKPETAKPAATVSSPVTAKPATPANAGAGKTKKSLTLINIGLHFKGGGMALRIEADAPFSYKTFALPSPDRYVVDLVGTWEKLRAPTVPANNMIKGARAGKQAGGPRLVLDMSRAPKKHNVTWITPTTLEIVIE